MAANLTSVPCRPDTLRDLRSLKRGGETYDELLNGLMRQYDPEISRKQAQ